MFSLKYTIVLALFAICESYIMPPFLHPITMQKYHEILDHTKNGYTEARRIYGFSLTFTQFEKETENSIYSRMITDEKKLYDSVVEKFHSYFLNGNMKNLQSLVEHIGNNSKQIKKLDKRLEEIYCASEKAKNETVHVSELNKILKFFSKSSLEDFTALKNDIELFTKEERQVAAATMAVIDDVTLRLDELSLMNFSKFLKEYKRDIKKLTKKVRRIEIENSHLEDVSFEDENVDRIFKRRKNDSANIELQE